MPLNPGRTGSHCVPLGPACVIRGASNSRSTREISFYIRRHIYVDYFALRVRGNAFRENKWPEIVADEMRKPSGAPKADGASSRSHEIYVFYIMMLLSGSGARGPRRGGRGPVCLLKLLASSSAGRKRLVAKDAALSRHCHR